MQATPGKPPAGPEENGKKKNAWMIPCAIGCAVVFGLSSCAAIGVVAAIAVPNFRAARGRANQRACFANQKTLAGAIEMYKLDENVDVTNLDADMLATLRDKGYLQRIPEDPGQGPGTSSNYLLIPTTDSRGRPDHRIFCTRHGFIQPPSGSTRDSPRKQLIDLGIDDADLLDRCHRNDPRFPSN